MKLKAKLVMVQGAFVIYMQNEYPNGGMFFPWVFHDFAGFAVFSMAFRYFPD